MSGFDWREYLGFAESVKDFNTDAANRAGISRSYYAVFGHAKMFCVNNYLLKMHEITKHDAHSRITKTLIDADDVELEEIGHRIKVLKIRREEADYQAYCENIDNEYLLDTIRRARKVLELIADY